MSKSKRDTLVQVYEGDGVHREMPLPDFIDGYLAKEQTIFLHCKEYKVDSLSDHLSSMKIEHLEIASVTALAKLCTVVQWLAKVHSTRHPTVQFVVHQEKYGTSRYSNRRIHAIEVNGNAAEIIWEYIDDIEWEIDDA